MQASIVQSISLRRAILTENEAKVLDSTFPALDGRVLDDTGLHFWLNQQIWNLEVIFCSWCKSFLDRELGSDDSPTHWISTEVAVPTTEPRKFIRALFSVTKPSKIHPIVAIVREALARAGFRSRAGQERPGRGQGKPTACQGWNARPDEARKASFNLELVA